MPRAARGVTKEKIKNLRDRGKSYSEISRELGIGVSTVGRHCADLGLTGVSAKEEYRPSSLVESRKRVSLNNRQEFKGIRYAKGYWAEFLVAAELIKRGFFVCQPMFPVSGTDLLVYRQRKCSRIEVKTAVDCVNKTGPHHYVQLTASTLKEGRLVRKPVKEIDFVIVLVPHNMAMLVVPFSKVTGGRMRIRWFDSENLRPDRWWAFENRWDLLEESLL